MDKHISISQESSTTREIRMDFRKNCSKKNNLLVYSQILFGIIQALEELKNKWVEDKAVEKG